MPFQEGNQLWKLRERHGRGKIYETKEKLWEAAVEYFQWNADNPLKEEKLFHYQGEIIRENVSKMRAMSIEAMCLHIGISTASWYNNYSKIDDFLDVTKDIEGVLRSQKFEGAAADLLNANIIARDLGLKDSKEIDITDLRDVTPWDMVEAGED